jgi:hypothetical protein
VHSKKSFDHELAFLRGGRQKILLNFVIVENQYLKDCVSETICLDPTFLRVLDMDPALL